ncbi:class I SAM-dependent methyltransferase [Myxococcus llanfairpwllgwyngyllgogerychwyrndrobwllllantysiliogogogochensis]|uniref:Class I SAM-dependent methyltransferase n=1 Tax=Myxococcus llanfairpwllgwyngyllgogerychwyrndrobwllllantysiliogogogochensis TaxID=2590453 RepID=A0A540X7R8_9BACT|nr:class I SAM-dependent methyltransferase [Myxococcus llanfairpwllgwyngyllgogerychwyrndrobwllllantysiliogogogochensis]TQF17270.1 class I SAM-dependent methyltransferase [Myxococcus llanfairpwllgwyngyllgogerychwyrndrobwllllantysiliogogogochensis]
MKLYDELAEWWPLVSPPSDYEEEASEYRRLLHAGATGPLVTVLELGSGGGNNASFLKRDFRLTLVEPSEGMRKHSRELNPECEHLPGDMRTVRLGREFDAVFIHDAVEYMTTETDLRSALETAAMHLRPGGVVLVAPDATQESFVPGSSTEGGDEPEAPGRGSRSLRYLMWTLPPKLGSNTSETHFAMLLKERDGSVRSVHDVHLNGLFSRATWLRLFDEAGLDARLETRTLEGAPYDTFVAVKRRESREASSSPGVGSQRGT